MSDYYHHVGKLGQPKGHERIKDEPVKCNGLALLVVQMIDENGEPYVSIPGAIENYKSRAYGEVKVSTIKGYIPHEIRGLEEAVREIGYKGPIVLPSNQNI